MKLKTFVTMKSRLLILCLLLLISFHTFSNQEAEKQRSAPLKKIDTVSHFDVSEFQLHNEGDVPAPQLFFPVSPKTSNAFPTSEKTKKIVRNLFHSRLNNIYKLAHFQSSVFNWHSSVFIHLFLKTACFRI